MISCLSGKNVAKKVWAEVKHIVDEINMRVCRHASFTEILLLLDQNNMWKDAVKKCASQTIEKCRACRATAPSLANRRFHFIATSRTQ